MRICLTLFLSLCAICLQAQNVDAIFSKANKNYNLGSYKEALKGYDSIVQLGVHSPELYYWECTLQAQSHCAEYSEL